MWSITSPARKKLVTYPWNNGLKVEEIEAYYDQIGFSDWTHQETGAGVLKAQHPEFEMWNQGIHARSGVACADCHMPYVRQGAMKISDHHVCSPLLNVERACLVCHPCSAAEMRACAETIQERNSGLLSRAEDALVALYDEVMAAKAAGAGPEQLAPALALQRKAQFRADFVNAENSMGFMRRKRRRGSWVRQLTMPGRENWPQRGREPQSRVRPSIRGACARRSAVRRAGPD